jgi:hypothetical protein
MQDINRSQEGTIKHQVSAALKSASNLPSQQIGDNYDEQKTEVARMASGMSR